MVTLCNMWEGATVEMPTGETVKAVSRCAHEHVNIGKHLVLWASQHVHRYHTVGEHMNMWDIEYLRMGRDHLHSKNRRACEHVKQVKRMRNVFSQFK